MTQNRRATIVSSMTGAITHKMKILAGALLLTFVVPVAVMADASISQGFSTKETIGEGMLVSTTSEDQLVAKADTDSSERLLGIASKQSLVELSNEDDTDSSQVQVVTRGQTLAFVSTINGDVKAGDPITASPLKGVGMKAVETSYIVGTAQADFADADNITEKVVIDKDGKPQTVKVGILPIQVQVTQYIEQDNQRILPQFIFNVAQVVAGRDVSVIRVLIALVVLLVGVGSIGVLLYASVRSSIISIGRNPLAAGAVNRSLLEVSALSIGVLLLMLGAVYLILSL